MMDEDYEYEVRCDGEFVAGTSGPDDARALKEAMYYAMQYTEEGEVEIYSVMRRKVQFEVLTPTSTPSDR